MVSELLISNWTDGFSRISDDGGSGCISASVVIVHDDVPGCCTVLDSWLCDSHSSRLGWPSADLSFFLRLVALTAVRFFEARISLIVH